MRQLVFSLAGELVQCVAYSAVYAEYFAGAVGREAADAGADLQLPKLKVMRKHNMLSTPLTQANHIIACTQ